jgi:hypothetical protein
VRPAATDASYTAVHVQHGPESDPDPGAPHWCAKVAAQWPGAPLCTQATHRQGTQPTRLPASPSNPRWRGRGVGPPPWRPTGASDPPPPRVHTFGAITFSYGLGLRRKRRQSTALEAYMAAVPSKRRNDRGQAPQRPGRIPLRLGSMPPAGAPRGWGAMGARLRPRGGAPQPQGTPLPSPTPTAHPSPLPPPQPPSAGGTQGQP